MLTLSFWEQLVIGMAISFLSAIAPMVTNATEQAALQAALTFLQKLVSGGVTANMPPAVSKG